MKSYDETTRNVMARVNEYREIRKQRRKEFAIVASVAAVCVIITAVLIFGDRREEKDRFVRSEPYNDEVKQSDTAQTPSPSEYPTPKATMSPSNNPTNTPKNTDSGSDKNTETPKPTSKTTNTPKPTPTQKPSPSAKPTNTPKPTPTPTAEPTAAPTSDPGEPIGDEYGIGLRIIATGRAYNAYLRADKNDELTFKFQSTRNPESSQYVKDFRHDGMTFDEWEHITWKACEEALEIYHNIRDNNIRVEYGVDISQYPWTQRSVYKSEYGDYYRYLPPEWFEKMDFYVTNNDAYWDAWDECMYKQAQDEAAFFGKFAVSVRIVSNGDKVRGYHLVATILKSKLDTLSYALEYTFRMDVC